MPAVTSTPEGSAAGTRVAEGVASVITSWKRIAGYAIVTGAVASGLVLVLPQRYQTTFSITPSQTTGTLGATSSSLLSAAQGLGLGGIASALGARPDLDYFVALLNSRTLAENVLLHPLPRGLYARDTTAANLLAVYGVDPDGFEYSLEQGVRKFGDRLDVKADPTSGVISIEFSAPTAALARAVGRITLETLDDLNTSINRQTTLARERFSQRQVGESQRRLLAAEDSLQTFYVANRQFGSSPVLTFQEGRLKRRVDLAQSVYVSLSQQYEQARLDASSDLPSFAVVDQPNTPALRSFPKRRRAVMAAMILVILGLSATIFTKTAFLRAGGESSDALAAVAAAAKTASGEAAALYRRLVRRRTDL